MLKEQIFEKMNGFLVEGIPVSKEAAEIADEFSAEKECGHLYDEVYEAKRRVCMRLGKEEDRDIEDMLSGMEKITRVISMKMYECGRKGSFSEQH